MLARIARSGRYVLIAGLLAGAGSPGLAAQLAPWVPEMVAALLFLNAFRSGPEMMRAIGPGLRQSLPMVALLQLGLPLVALGAAALVWDELPAFVFAALLMMAAPSLTGAANFMAMIGYDPAPAMRLLVVGTLMFPLTAFAVLWAMPGIAAVEATAATLRLAGVILLVVGAGVLARHVAQTHAAPGAINSVCDALSVILLGIVVVGLMSAVGPLLRSNPTEVSVWVVAVCALNLGLMALGKLIFPTRVEGALIAGNRNIALFLIALPEETTRQAMVFIGCYQVPMYLTPFFAQMLGLARR